MSRFHLPIRVVLYRDEGLWVAYCLEFGQLGTGETQDEAIHLMLEATGMMVEFAAEEGRPETLFTPAEPWAFQLFAESFPMDKAVSYPEPATEFLAIEGIEFREPAATEAVCI